MKKIRMGHRVAVLVATVLLAVGVHGIPTSHAATVVLTNLHLASGAGNNQPEVTKFSSGTKTVYFDYTVDAPYGQDNGQVVVYAGGTTGTPLATSNLVFEIRGPSYAPLALSTGSAFADGGYCAVLIVDNAADSQEGQAPIPFSVGNATPPSCRLPQSSTPGTGGATATPTLPGSPATASPTATHTTPQLTLTSSSAVHQRRAGTVRIVVRANNAPVSGARVRIDGRKVGISHLLKTVTGPKGIATFHRVQPMRTGKLIIAAFKTGYKKATMNLTVRK